METVLWKNTQDFNFFCAELSYHLILFFHKFLKYHFHSYAVLFASGITGCWIHPYWSGSNKIFPRCRKEQTISDYPLSESILGVKGDWPEPCRWWTWRYPVTSISLVSWRKHWHMADGQNPGLLDSKYHPLVPGHDPRIISLWVSAFGKHSSLLPFLNLYLPPEAQNTGFIFSFKKRKQKVKMRRERWDE